MKNIILITKREFLTQVKKKSFIILTLLAPLLIVGFGVLVSMLFKANETNYTFNVIDKSGIFAPQLKSNERLNYIIASENSEKQLKAALNEIKNTDGLLIIPPLENGRFDLLEKQTTLLTNKKIGLDTKTKISSDLEKIIRSEKTKQLGLTPSQINDLNQRFHLTTRNVIDKEQEDNDMIFTVKYSLSMILMYVVFMFIIIYGVRVMRSVLEEKNNRVVEIIISSVKPFELMLGKILGVTLVALTQFTLWIAMTLTAAFFLNTQIPLKPTLALGAEQQATSFDLQLMAAEISHILLQLNFPMIIFVFIAFFLLGYVFYSSIYAAIGSAVDNETETQQFTFFAILPLTIGMYGSISVVNNPEGPTAFWLSMIPFTSPVAMIARIPFGVALWEVAVSIALLVASTLLMVYAASKIYRVGILMYGNKASLKEIWKWMRH